MLKIEVKRHAQGLKYFTPWIEEHDEGRSGCTFHFHHDDISNEGAARLSELITQQVQLRWRPRSPDEPTGRRIPVTMERRTVMEGRDIVAVTDRPDHIAYTVRADLISARGAALITREQTKLTERWRRLSGRRLQAV